MATFWRAGCVALVFWGCTGGQAAEEPAGADLGDAANLEVGAVDGGAVSLEAGSVDAGAVDVQGGSGGQGEDAAGGSSDAAVTCAAPCPEPTEPCLKAVCLAGVCATVARPNGLPCDDGETCTDSTVCTKGVCGGGTFVCGCVPPSKASLPRWQQYPEIAGGAKDCPPNLVAGDKCSGETFCDDSGSFWKCAPVPDSEVNCPDLGLACVASVCNAQTGLCEAVALADGKFCDDGEPCTANDVCVSGQCHGAIQICKCKPETAKADCANVLGGTSCLDVTCLTKTGANGLPDNECVAKPVVCPTGADTACLKSACDPATETCKLTPVTHVKTVPANCAKTGETCGLVVTSNPTPYEPVCDDGDPCTASETCWKGVCAAPDPEAAAALLKDADPKNDHKPTGGQGTAICVCQKDADCQDDGNKCNGTPICVANQCVLDPATVVVCDVSKDATCAKTACVPTTGVCAPLLPSGIACDDGDACTVNEACEGGKCTGGLSLCPCLKDADCSQSGSKCHGPATCNTVTGKCGFDPATAVKCPDDGPGACLNSACDPETGKCGPIANSDTAPCKDGKACLMAYCQSGACTASSSTCACTADADCAAFDDGNPCSGTLGCLGGVCVTKPGTAVTCGAAQGCTTKACDPKTGKCTVEVGNYCSDGNPCTADACSDSGKCLHMLRHGVPCPGGMCGNGACIKAPPATAIVSVGFTALGCNPALDKACTPEELPQLLGIPRGFMADRLEVTVSRYDACVKAGACKPAATGGKCNTGVAGHGLHPQNCVTWAQAQAFCSWAWPHGRLPTEAEWETLARGPCLLGADCKKVAATYVWGEAPAPDCGQAQLLQPGSAQAGCDGSQTSNTPTRPGTDQSLTGVFDLAGSVREWTIDAWDKAAWSKPGAAAALPRRPKTSAELIAVRGGGFLSGPQTARIARREGMAQSAALADLGFRCVLPTDPVAY